MRILFIVNHFYPELGAIRTEYEIARKLAEHHELLVVTTFPRAYRLPKGVLYNVPKLRIVVVEQYGKLRVLRVKSFLSRFEELKQRIAELISSLKTLLIVSFFLTPFYDVLLVAGDIELLVAQIGILLKLVWRKPVVVVLHDIHPDVLVRAGVLKKGLLFKFFELLIRSFARYVDTVIVHSHSNAVMLAKRYNMPMDKIRVVELWANVEDLERITRSLDIVKLRQEFVPEEGKFIVSFAGIMNPPQGLDVVICAAQCIKERYPSIASKIVFLLVGEGMEKVRLIKLAKELRVDDMVKFFPLQPRDRYVGILLFSDICLVTLRKDYVQPVVPSKLFEIMAAGRPALLSMPTISDAVKIVTKYGCGIYAGNGDPEALAKAIVTLYKRRHLLQSLGRNGRRAVMEYFNLARAVSQYEGILSKVRGV